jgi:hypothetical protein
MLLAHNVYGGKRAPVDGRHPDVYANDVSVLGLDRHRAWRIWYSGIIPSNLIALIACVQTEAIAVDAPGMHVYSQSSS